MSRRQEPVVAVVGAGIAGMAAAWELVSGDRSGGAVPEVHLFDRGPRTGGHLQSAEFAGRVVDLAADAFVARRPEATDLCAEIGLTEELVAPGAAGASVWARGRSRRMPKGLNLGVPTRWWPLARSGVLDPAEALGVVKDLVTLRLGARGVAGDRAVGAIVGERLGRPVVERLVDPLIGGINAGNVDDLSSAATFPYLLAASLQPGSLMRRMRTGSGGRPPDGEADTGVGRAPVFWSLPGGTAQLADRLSAELVRHGVTIRTGVALDRLGGRRGDRNGSGSSGWALDLRPGGAGSADPTESFHADGVVLALPAGPAAALLAPHAPEAAGLLAGIEYASVAIATFAFPPGSIRRPLYGTGLLVPRTTRLGGKEPLVTAVTYLDRKWPHLSRDGDVLVRASVGRFGDDRHLALGDDELCDAVLSDLGHLLGASARPVDSMVARFDRAFPQYEVGHLIRVARIEQSVSALAGVEIAGSAYRGVGIPACIGSGREAAGRLLRFLVRPARTAGAPSIGPDARA